MYANTINPKMSWREEDRHFFRGEEHLGKKFGQSERRYKNIIYDGTRYVKYESPHKLKIQELFFFQLRSSSHDLVKKKLLYSKFTD